LVDIGTYTDVDVDIDRYRCRHRYKNKDVGINKLYIYIVCIYMSVHLVFHSCIICVYEIAMCATHATLHGETIKD